MDERIDKDELPQRLMECLEQSRKGQDDDNEDIKILPVNGRKVATTIAGAKPVFKKLLTISTRGFLENTEQSDSEQIDNDQEITILACKSRKVVTTTTGTKPASKKLLTTLAKRALRKDMQDVSMRKV